MEKYDKDKIEFIKSAVKRLSKYYPKLAIFSKTNNPYLQYKENWKNMSEYQEIQNKKEWW